MKRICTIGGGTGNFVVLRGLKKYNHSISAIVAMADNGGSTGVLRDELGVLPSGDARQCIVALSNSSGLMRNLMNYRFETGGFSGHNFGNLFLSALEKVTGSFETAIEEVSRILKIKGKVLPVTTQEVHLKMLLKDHTFLEGEEKIYLSERIDQGYSSIFLEPIPKANPHALSEIKNADAIIIGPGGLYTSLISNLLVPGVAKAIADSKAHKIFVVNLMNRNGQTTHFKVSDYLKELGKYIDISSIDSVLVNDQAPPKNLIKAYASQGDLVHNDMTHDPRIVSAPLLGELATQSPTDLLKRNLIRHESAKLAAALNHILEKEPVTHSCGK